MAILLLVLLLLLLLVVFVFLFVIAVFLVVFVFLVLVVFVFLVLVVLTFLLVLLVFLVLVTSSSYVEGVSNLVNDSCHCYSLTLSLSRKYKWILIFCEGRNVKMHFYKGNTQHLSFSFYFILIFIIGAYLVQPSAFLTTFARRI
ncbi:unnamed protein product [Prunus brigantina]